MLRYRGKKVAGVFVRFSLRRFRTTSSVTNCSVTFKDINEVRPAKITMLMVTTVGTDGSNFRKMTYQVAALLRRKAI
jgi:hypothetical protein